MDNLGFYLFLRAKDTLKAKGAFLNKKNEDEKKNLPSTPRTKTESNNEKEKEKEKDKMSPSGKGQYPHYPKQYNSDFKIRKKLTQCEIFDPERQKWTHGYWNGEIVNDKANGKGIAFLSTNDNADKKIYHSGLKIEGTFSFGKPDGWCDAKTTTNVHKNNGYYTGYAGQYKDGALHGEVMRYFSNA